MRGKNRRILQIGDLLTHFLCKYIDEGTSIRLPNAKFPLA